MLTTTPRLPPLPPANAAGHISETPAGLLLRGDCGSRAAAAAATAVDDDRARTPATATQQPRERHYRRRCRYRRQHRHRRRHDIVTSSGAGEDSVPQPRGC